MHAGRLAVGGHIVVVTALTVVLGAALVSRPDPSPPREEVAIGGTPEPSSRAAGSGLGYRLTPVADVPSPIAVTALIGSDDLLVASRSGEIHRIRRVRRDGEVVPVLDPEPLVDLADEIGELTEERGLLDLVVDPAGRSLYVSFTDPSPAVQVWQYAIDDGVVDTTRHWPVLRVPKPTGRHNGGDILFGPDGYLYVSLGDGGSNRTGPSEEWFHSLEDPQDPHTLIGSMLRIEPRAHDAGYSVPEDNPFADGVDGRPEVWLYGVRNPWRSSFDPEGGDLWITDVGFDDREEIDRLEAPRAGESANLGWGRLEGTRVVNNPPVPPDAVPPVFEYGHNRGRCAVIGGALYRGRLLPALDGAFVFTDFCDPVIRGLVPAGEGWDEISLDVEVLGGSIGSIDAGPGGELYISDLAGTVYRLDPATDDG